MGEGVGGHKGAEDLGHRGEGKIEAAQKLEGKIEEAGPGHRPLIGAGKGGDEETKAEGDREAQEKESQTFRPKEGQPHPKSEPAEDHNEKDLESVDQEGAQGKAKEVATFGKGAGEISLQEPDLFCAHDGAGHAEKPVDEKGHEEDPGEEEIHIAQGTCFPAHLPHFHGDFSGKESLPLKKGEAEFLHEFLEKRGSGARTGLPAAVEDLNRSFSPGQKFCGKIEGDEEGGLGFPSLHFLSYPG